MWAKAGTPEEKEAGERALDEFFWEATRQGTAAGYHGGEWFVVCDSEAVADYVDQLGTLGRPGQAQPLSEWVNAADAMVRRIFGDDPPFTISTNASDWPEFSRTG